MEVLGSNEEGSSSQIRKQYYQFAIDFFSEHPFFGVGLDQFRVWSPYHGYSHSTYAEALADWGFLGCLVYFLPALWAGIKILQLSFSNPGENTLKVVFAVWVMEVFLGLGQIWFYKIEHLIAWTIIFITIDMHRSTSERRYKYVKD